MNKYTRKQINKNASLHDKEFISVEDLKEFSFGIAKDIAKYAIDECGVSEAKMMEFFEGDGDEEDKVV